MEQILTKANNQIDGVVSANDGMSGGIIGALKAQRMAWPGRGFRCTSSGRPAFGAG
jgi:ABC-type xylose transport system substrate-binding protein